MPTLPDGLKCDFDVREFMLFLLTPGKQIDDDARKAIHEDLRKGQELKKKMMGMEGDSDADDFSGSEDAEMMIPSGSDSVFNHIGIFYHLGGRT